MNRETARGAFREYTEHYDTSDVKIALKIAHTYRVAEIAGRIAKSIGLKARDIDFAWFLGLLHDIGRFEQLSRFDTFIDADSVDHAELGADILFTEDGTDTGPLIDAFDVKEAFDGGWESTAETAIRLHNKLSLPEGLDERTLIFCNILRDADKCDIFRVLTEPPYDERNSRIVKGSADGSMGAARQAVMECVAGHCCVPRDSARTEFEGLISQCCMAFELNYSESRSIASEQGYLDKLITLPVADGAMREQLRLLADEIKRAWAEV